MKILAMRAHRGSTVLILAVAAMAGTALAQSKGKKPAKAPAKAPAKTPAPTPAPAKGSGDEGEIEMNPDDAKKPAGGSGSYVNPDEIDMGEPENKQGDLKADLNIADQGSTPVVATPFKKTP